MGAVSAPLIAYAGDTALRFDPRGGDMYSHWFRALALATAAQVLPRERRVAAWDFGFRDQISQGWWPGTSGAGVAPEGAGIAQEGAPC
jgi:hypothetical protein